MKINDVLEKIVYINLADRVDKDNTLKSHLAENGIVSERVEGIDGRNYKENEDGELVRDHQVNENGLRDVYEAYCKTLIGILTQAEIDGTESVLIMQDDVQFTSDAVEVFAECTQRRERTIEVDDLELIVRDIKYKQKLELKGEFHDVYRNGVDNVKQKEFNSLLGSVAEIAFSDPESGLKEYDYDSELKILTKTMMEYLELSDESKKVDGD